ncbi:MAG: proton-conducting transporter membrane subunit [candidate division WOR-3 bacterium]
MNSLVLAVLLPVVSALLGFFIVRLRNEFSFIGVILTLYFGLRIFLSTKTQPFSYHLFDIGSINLSLYADSLAGLLLLIAGFLALLLILYSFRYIRNLSVPMQKYYYFYTLAGLATVNGLVLAKSLFLGLFFFGFLTLISYGLSILNSTPNELSSKKLNLAWFVLCLPLVTMLLATFLLAATNQGQAMLVLEDKIPLTQPASLISFSLFIITILSLILTRPLIFTWLSELSYSLLALPLILNNSLAIYLLLRVNFSLFDLTSNSIFTNWLIATSVILILLFTILGARQKKFVKNLALYSISQAGYIMIAVVTALPIGIIGGLFHMINTALYQTALFLAFNSIAYRILPLQRAEGQDKTNPTTGTLIKKMPFTTGAFLIAGLSFAGIPPLNGFFSQWLIYQALLSKIHGFMWIILAGILLGSIITLAFLLKTIQRLIFAPTIQKTNRVIEVGFSMSIAPSLLALLAILFGIFVKKIPLNLFILPSAKPFLGLIPKIEYWKPWPITTLMISWVGLGILFFLISTNWRKRNFCYRVTKTPPLISTVLSGLWDKFFLLKTCENKVTRYFHWLIKEGKGNG